MSVHNVPEHHARGQAPPPQVAVAPKRSTIPYAPRNRKTAPGSVLVPITEAEIEFYRNLSKNPLRERAKLGKRKLEDMTNELPKNGREKRQRDMGAVADYCECRLYQTCITS